MSIERVTSYGNINISQEAIATLAGGVVSECYGVVGMASQKLVKDGWAELLKKENYSRGVVVRKTEREWNWIYISSSASALRCRKSSVKYRRK